MLLEFSFPTLRYAIEILLSLWLHLALVIDIAQARLRSAKLRRPSWLLLPLLVTTGCFCDHRRSTRFRFLRCPRISGSSRYLRTRDKKIHVPVRPTPPGLSPTSIFPFPWQTEQFPSPG